MQTMGLLPDAHNCWLRMLRECRECFPRRWLQRKKLVGAAGMHVPWCISGSINHGNGENAPCIPGACAIRNFSYLVRGPCLVLTLLRCCLYQAIKTDPQNLSTSKVQCDNTVGCSLYRSHSMQHNTDSSITWIIYFTCKQNPISRHISYCEDFREHWLCYKGTALSIGNCVAIMTAVIVNKNSRFWNPADCYNIRYPCET